MQLVPFYVLWKLAADLTKKLFSHLNQTYSSLLLQKRDVYFQFLTEPLALPLTLSANNEIQGRVAVALLEVGDPSRTGLGKLFSFKSCLSVLELFGCKLCYRSTVIAELSRVNRPMPSSASEYPCSGPSLMIIAVVCLVFVTLWQQVKKKGRLSMQRCALYTWMINLAIHNSEHKSCPKHSNQKMGYQKIRLQKLHYGSKYINKGSIWTQGFSRTIQIPTERTFFYN